MQESEIQTTTIQHSNVPYLQEETQHKDCTIYGVLGGTAGLLMEGFLHPIDTVRTRMKANTKETVSLFNQVKIMQKHEGSLSYFKGGSCTLAGAFVSNFTYFYLYEKLKEVLHNKHWMSRDSAPFAAAFAGGFIANVLYLPFDVVRTRMQLKPGHYDYRHFLDGTKQILKYEGFQMLYLGGPAFFTLNALETSLTFGFYELFHRLLKPLFPTTSEVNLPLSVVCSVSAASLAGFVVNPLDVLVTRLQSVNTSVHGSVSSYVMIKRILKNEGIGGFFKGVTGTMAYYALGALILFPTYEVLKSAFHVDLSE